MKFYKYILWVVLIIHSVSLCWASEIEEKEEILTTVHSKFTHGQWISSANITFGDKIAIDIDKSRRLNSDQLLEWHMAQAPELSNTYNNYQNTGRNVAKYLVSAVYEKEDNNLEITHRFSSSVFINGWSVKDTLIELKPKQHRHLHFKKEEKPDETKIENFLSLRDITAPPDLSMLNSFGLISGFSSASNFVEESNKYDRYIKGEEGFHLTDKMDSLRTKQSHAEKTILIYIYKNIDSIIKELSVPKNNKIKYFIINIASYRDMCPACQELGIVQKPLNKLIAELQQRIIKIIPESSDLQLKVISSGINGFTGQVRPEFPDCRQPIDLDSFQGAILHMLQSPIFTCGFDKNSKTYLSVKKNYFKHW